MSERVPGVEDIRQALRGDGWTLDEANEGIERIKRRGIGIGQEMARETVREATGDAVRKLQAIAWDEGHSWGWSDAQEAHDVQQEMDRADWHLCTSNPYRKDEGDE